MRFRMRKAEERNELRIAHSFAFFASSAVELQCVGQIARPTKAPSWMAW